MSADARFDELLDQLNHNDPRVRRKACIKLGRHGNPEAIKPLVDIYYHADEDLRVREAAEKALRRFAAKQASRTRPAIIYRILTVLLMLSLAGLVALNVLARTESSPTEEVVATVTPRLVLLESFTNDVVLLALDDINGLRAEFERGAGQLTCELEMHRVESAPLSATNRNAYPDIAAIADDLNTALQTISNAAATWDEACAAEEKGTEEQISGALDSINEAETMIFTAVEELTQAQSGPVETAVPTATLSPTPTLTRTPTATPTITPTPLNTIEPTTLRDLERIITNGVEITTLLLDGSWLVVQAGGTPALGCEFTSLIDDDYVPTPELLEEVPVIAVVIDVINNGLALTRESVESFRTNCRNGTLTEEVINQGIQNAEAARENFQQAKEAIDVLKAERGQ